MTRTTLLESRDTAPKVVVRTVKGLFSPDARWRDKTVVFRRTITMGREGGPEDIVIDDPLMSRRHAELKIVSDDGAVGLLDLESRNGTEVVGVRVIEALLRPGSTLKLGQVAVRFDELAAGQPPLNAAASAPIRRRS